MAHKTISYREKLRKDFTSTYLEILYDDERKVFLDIYFYSSDYGTIKWEKGVKKVRRWENEDEAKSTSYTNNRFTSIFLADEFNGSDTEENILHAVFEFLSRLSIPSPEMSLIEQATKSIRAK